jgi:hypothetical protein
MDIFATREIDPDTTIVSEERLDLEGIPVLVEHWRCDGISGVSYVIPRAQVEHMGEAEVIALMRRHIALEGYTYSSKPGSQFIFVNHNFYRNDD